MTKECLKTKISKLERTRNVLTTYLHCRYEQEDWLAVADAAYEIKDLNSQLEVYQEWLQDVEKACEK